MLPDDSQRRVQSQSHTRAHWLGREERLENPALDVLAHASAVIGNLNHRRIVLATRPDAKFSNARHRIERIFYQVRPDLMESANIGQERPHEWVVVPHERDAVTQPVCEHRKRRVQALVYVNLSFRGTIHPRIVLEGIDQPPDSLRCVLDVGEQLANADSRCQPGKHTGQVRSVEA